MNLAHVIALDPTVKQNNALARACGVARFTYNWGLAEWKRQYAAGGKPTAAKLKKQFNAIKGQQFPWVYDSPRDANSQAFADLGAAYKNFFSSVKGKRKGRNVAPPTFKKKGQKDAFYVSNDKFYFADNGWRVYLPVVGLVKVREQLRFHGRVLSGRVQRKAGRWFLAVQVDVGDVHREHTAERRPVVGVDLGIKHAVATSAGEFFQAPKPLKKAFKKLRRHQRQLARRKKGGQNRDKTRMSVARIHFRIANIRRDFWHKVTTRLCRENQAVVVEDLSMGFMLRNRKLARMASDVGLGMFRPLMRYKAPLHDCELAIAERAYPSTQRCSGCGMVKVGDDRLDLSVRVYHCGICGMEKDRDGNAASNLEQYPRLEGNWRRVPSTPTDTSASTVLFAASAVDEVGTKSSALVHTN